MATGQPGDTNAAQAPETDETVTTTEAAVEDTTTTTQAEDTTTTTIQEETTTTTIPQDTTTTTVLQETTTTTTEKPAEDEKVDAERGHRTAEQESKDQEKATADAINSGRSSVFGDTDKPANDHVLGDNETSPEELIANARAEAIRNHEKDQKINR